MKCNWCLWHWIGVMKCRQWFLACRLQIANCSDIFMSTVSGRSWRRTKLKLQTYKVASTFSTAQLMIEQVEWETSAQLPNNATTHTLPSDVLGYHVKSNLITTCSKKKLHLLQDDALSFAGSTIVSAAWWNSKTPFLILFWLLLLGLCCCAYFFFMLSCTSYWKARHST